MPIDPLPRRTKPTLLLPGRMRKAHPRKGTREPPQVVAVKQRARHLRRTYGMTEDEYLGRLLYQAGVCAICGVLPKPERKLVVDHDHATGQVRGLLCSECNTGIGLFAHDPERLEQALAYLRKHA